MSPGTHVEGRCRSSHTRKSERRCVSQDVNRKRGKKKKYDGESGGWGAGNRKFLRCVLLSYLLMALHSVNVVSTH